MDIKSRLRNKTFILCIIAFIVLVIKTFTNIQIPDNFDTVVNMALSILIGLGIIIDPCSPGISDTKFNLTKNLKTKRRYVLKKDSQDNRDYLFKNLFNNIELPLSIDLREKMPPLFDQGQEGSCTANAGAGDREYMLQKDSIKLSRQFLYNVERIIEGTFPDDNGAQMRTICKALNKYGISEESYLPYNEENLSAAPSEESYKNALQYRISSYYRVLSETEIRQALSQGQAVLLGMIVYENFEDVGSDGLVRMPNKKTEQILGGHSVLIVGYRDNVKNKFKTLINKLIGKSNGYFIVRNSWGENWGDKGYFYLPYEVFSRIKQDIWVIIK
ncbi:phage holin [Clostridium pasteurianum]|uniref:Cysteine protease n=1 Tax=Clostridium pasteurianum BC1 TaxID=86416 RepID=R4K2N7_CLOPA|nr:phage holin [Clostridium pasteurianum]AGK95986.1 cysteine protease [Clostridium pasteurianum BC1]